jgi:hypothetical protein
MLTVDKSGFPKASRKVNTSSKHEVEHRSQLPKRAGAHKPPQPQVSEEFEWIDHQITSTTTSLDRYSRCTWQEIEPTASHYHHHPPASADHPSSIKHCPIDSEGFSTSYIAPEHTAIHLGALYEKGRDQ